MAPRTIGVILRLQQKSLLLSSDKFRYLALLLGWPRRFLKGLQSTIDVIPQTIHHSFGLAERTVRRVEPREGDPCPDPAEPHLNSALEAKLLVQQRLQVVQNL